jgi:hypothetical protein
VESTSEQRASWWQRRSLPVKVGLTFGALALMLAIIGIARGNVPLNPTSVVLALLISAGSWFLVSWAITLAAVDVERDVAEAQAGDDTATP